jgi:hypothetical protein
LGCGAEVGFRASDLAMGTVEHAAESGLGKCRNWSEHGACNWFAVTAQHDGYCFSCALNDVVPDLGDDRRRELWRGTERAKRRLVFTLLELKLPLVPGGDKNPLRFRLLADERADTGHLAPPSEAPVFTGHEDGVLTINVVEADDAVREATRESLGERYRTMLGHLRHELGHYVWYALVDGRPRHDAFRATFGDERADYAAAQRQHYERGAPPGWDASFVSTYATMHAFEDFAETWAHYVHMIDTLETAADARVSVEGRTLVSPLPLTHREFPEVLSDWLALTVGLNQLNRSMGLHDAYPFAVTPAIAAKLEFVDAVCKDFSAAPA